MTFPISPLLGADPENVSTTATHELGTQFVGDDGTEWMYVRAAGAITQYDAVGIELATFDAASLIKAHADAGRVVGFAQVAFADNDYGWVALKGQVTVRLKNGCLPAVALYTTASAGMLDDTSASQTRVYGIRSTDTATASGASKVCWVQGAVT